MYFDNFFQTVSGVARQRFEGDDSSAGMFGRDSVHAWSKVGSYQNCPDPHLSIRQQLERTLGPEKDGDDATSTLKTRRVVHVIAKHWSSIDTRGQ